MSRFVTHTARTVYKQQAAEQNSASSCLTHCCLTYLIWSRDDVVLVRQHQSTTRHHSHSCCTAPAPAHSATSCHKLSTSTLLSSSHCEAASSEVNSKLNCRHHKLCLSGPDITRDKIHKKCRRQGWSTTTTSRHLKTKLVEHVASCQSPVTSVWVQLSDAGRIIKPGTYFDAGPELTIEEHCCIRATILQDTTNRHTQGNRNIYSQSHTYRHKDSNRWWNNTAAYQLILHNARETHGETPRETQKETSRETHGEM